MEEFTKLQKLIRLKRFESPPPDFEAGFLSHLKKRQRSEMLNQSAPGLFWEQIKVCVSQFLAPKWALASVMVLMAGLSSWLLMPGNPTHKEHRNRARFLTIAIDGTGRRIPAYSIEAIRIMGAKLKADPGLLSRHFQGDYDQFVIVSDSESDESVGESQ